MAKAWQKLKIKKNLIKFDISISIIGINESQHLRELLPTLDWVSEIIYIDCESSDSSLAVAKKYNCRIFKKKNNLNLNLNKEFGIKQAKSMWVMYLDPDERLSEQLVDEVKRVIVHDSAYSAFICNRKNFYFTKFLNYGAYPDQQLRLFKNGRGSFPCISVHEKLIIKGKIGKLKGNMLHYTYSNFEEYFKKFNFYTSFEADFLKKQGVEINFFSFMSYVLIKPLDGFIRNYFFKKCFLDGFPGFVYSFLFGFQFTVRFLKLWFLYQKEKEKEKNS